MDDAPLIFYHFHEFKGVARNVVQLAGLTYRLPLVLVEHIYIPYIYALREAERDVGLGERIMRGERNRFWLSLLPGLLEQRWLLVKGQRLALTLWRLGKRQHDRLLTGLDAYRRGDLATARRLCFLAVLCNPLDLVDRQVLSILAKITLRPDQLSFLQGLLDRLHLSGRRG